jgi:hypothetical protein
MLGTAVFGPFCFKSLDLGPRNVPSTVKHPLDGGIDLNLQFQIGVMKA